MSEKEPDDYEVGYGKPPQQSKFKNGHSGNPKGRPKGSKNKAKQLEELLNAKVRVREGNTTRKVTMWQAMFIAIANKAMKGDPRAFQAVMKATKDLGISEPIVHEGGGVIVAPADKTPEQWIREQMEKNKTRKPPEDYTGH